MNTKIDMVGQRFGRLTVISEGDKRTYSRQASWVCRCDCGNITPPIVGYKLRHGEVKSCGCHKRDLTIERSTKHNLCHTRIYRIYALMKDRCTNPNATHYHRYGGRGISVCDEWKNNFQSFYDWAMTNGYSDKLSIDRIDNNGNYEPSNCRWATNEEQANNRGNQIFLEINGKRKTIAQWSKESGVKYRTIHARYNRGLTGESLIRKV